MLAPGEFERSPIVDPIVSPHFNERIVSSSASARPLISRDSWSNLKSGPAWPEQSRSVLLSSILLLGPAPIGGFHLPAKIHHGAIPFAESAVIFNPLPGLRDQA